MPHRFIVGPRGGHALVISSPDLEFYFFKVSELLAKGETSYLEESKIGEEYDQVFLDSSKTLEIKDPILWLLKILSRWIDDAKYSSISNQKSLLIRVCMSIPVFLEKKINEYLCQLPVLTYLTMASIVYVTVNGSPLVL